jgi:hypothetical protein
MSGYVITPHARASQRDRRPRPGAAPLGRGHPAGLMPGGLSAFVVDRIGGTACSVFVPVALVGSVPVAVMHVVDVIAVRNGDMAAVALVLMAVRVVDQVLAAITLVEVVLVDTVDMPIVGVVGVVGVLEGDVAAAGPMRVRVVGVDDVRWCGHGGAPSTDIVVLRRAVLPLPLASPIIHLYIAIYAYVGRFRPLLDSKAPGTRHDRRYRALTKMVIDSDKLRGRCGLSTGTGSRAATGTCAGYSP